MRLSTSSNIYFNRADGTKGKLEDCVKYCGEAGYRRMDISFLDYCNFRFPIVTDQYRRWIDEIMCIADSYGITFGQAHAPFYNFCDGTVQDKDEKDMLIRRSIECAGRMGIPWIAIHAGTDYSSGEMRKASKEKNRDYFLPLLEYAASWNVGIAFENLWDWNIAPRKRYTAMVEDLIDLVDSFDCEYAGICYDVEHAGISGLDPAKEILLIGDRLKSTHISDYFDIKADHLLPFTGVMEWRPFMKALASIRYEGDFAFEIHRYTEHTPDELVPSAIRYSLEVGNYLLGMAQVERGNLHE